MEIDREIRYYATRHLRTVPELRPALLWARTNQSDFDRQVDILDTVTGCIDETTTDPIRPPQKRTYVETFNFKNGVWMPSGYREHFEMWDDPEADVPSVDKIYASLRDAFSIKKEFSADPKRLAIEVLIRGSHILSSTLYDDDPAFEEAYYKGLLTELGGRILGPKDRGMDLFQGVLDIIKENCLSDPNPNQKYLNTLFSCDIPAYYALDTMRKFERPIAVDFNNVIANNGDPLQLNPDAPRFLDHLKGLGDVFIVTSAEGWYEVQQFFLDNNLWDPQMVLMTAETYCPVRTIHGTNFRRDTIGIVDEYLGQNSLNPDQRYLFRQKGFIAPYFSKRWDIPLIDDSRFNVGRGNIGIRGILVKPWFAESDDPMSLYGNDERDSDRVNLDQAVSIVRSHFTDNGLI